MAPPAPSPPELQRATEVPPSPIEQGQAALMKDVVAAMDKAIPDATGTVFHLPDVPTDSAPAVTHQLTDLAAGAIGSAANYLADQLGEMFAPTPPEVREANAKAAAKREVEQPAPEPKANPYAKIIDAAVRAIEAEREGKDDAYWKERDRGKDWERDR